MGLVRMWVLVANLVSTKNLINITYLFIYFCFMEGYGGYGFTSRKWGLTLDTIQSLQVVLANGTIANVSQTNYPDLFWVSILNFFFFCLRQPKKKIQFKGFLDRHYVVLLVLLVSSHLFRSKLFLSLIPRPSFHILGILVLLMPPAPRNSFRTSFRPISHRNSVQSWLSVEVPPVEESPWV